MIFSLNMMDCPMSFLLLTAVHLTIFDSQVEGIILRKLTYLGTF